MRLAIRIMTTVAAMLIAADRTPSAGVAEPRSSRGGIASGAEGGRNDAILTSGASGYVSAPIEMKNEARMTRLIGVIVFWRSSCRLTSEPATANSVL
jgi:hypothetical protein